MVDLGLEDCIGACKTKGLDTMAKFAFGCEFNPQNPDSSKLTDELLKPIAGEHTEHIPLLRMLWWESWGVATADLRRNAEGGTDGPRKLGVPELAERRKQTLKALPGLTVTQDLDVSDQLITEVVGIVDRNRLKYVAWEICTARTMEIAGGKIDQAWVTDPSTGYLKCETASAKLGDADLATDFKLDLALRRRGLAFDMGDLMSWNCHERLREDLMSALTRTPPPGYARTSKQQLRRADEVAFEIMAKATEGGVKRVGGHRPLDATIDRVLAHRDYNLALQPLPASSGSSNDKRQTDQDFDRRVAPRTDRAGKGEKGKGKGSKKGTGSKGSQDKKPKGALPEQLRHPGCDARDAKGNNICFAYNIDGCDAAPPGGTCPKGRHVCVLASCRKGHGYMKTHG